LVDQLTEEEVTMAELIRTRKNQQTIDLKPIISQSIELLTRIIRKRTLKILKVSKTSRVRTLFPIDIQEFLSIKDNLARLTIQKDIHI
jgi:hypothetical protein